MRRSSCRKSRRTARLSNKTLFKVQLNRGRGRVAVNRLERSLRNRIEIYNSKSNLVNKERHHSCRRSARHKVLINKWLNWMMMTMMNMTMKKNIDLNYDN